MLEALEQLPIDGHIVIGATEAAERLGAGQRIGAGGEPTDLALDPLEGVGIVARGGGGAMSMIASGPSGAFPTLPDMYMRKMAVGPTPRGKIDLRRPVAENIEAIAEAFGRRVGDVTTIVLDRPRHHDLIAEIRDAGARIKLIQDGDVTASISAAIRGTNDHLAIGIGGTRQAVLTAAALRCLGGEMQAQLWPTTRERDRARAGGRDPRHRADLLDRRPGPDRGDRGGDRAFRTATSYAGCGTARTARARTRSSCARAATGCASWTAPTSSRASAAKRFASCSLFGVPTKDDVTEALRGVEDPELGMDIVELGLLYDVEVDGQNVKVVHSLTSMGCPAGPMIQEGIHDATAAIPGVEAVEVELTWDPPWTPERMSDDAKFILGFG